MALRLRRGGGRSSAGRQTQTCCQPRHNAETRSPAPGHWEGRHALLFLLLGSARAASPQRGGTGSLRLSWCFPAPQPAPAGAASPLAGAKNTGLFPGSFPSPTRRHTPWLPATVMFSVPGPTATPW